jgi:hypothetical protein
MTWFKIRTYSTKIVPVEVTHETPAMVTVYSDYYKKEFRTAKHSQTEDYYPTFEMARTVSVQRRHDQITIRKKQIAELENEIHMLLQMEAPKS